MELKLIMLSEISDSERKIFYGFPHADCRFVSVSVCVCSMVWKCGSRKYSMGKEEAYRGM